MSENNNDSFNEEDPFVIMIYSMGNVYSIENIDYNTLFYVLNSYYFMYDSMIPDVAERIFEGGMQLGEYEKDLINKEFIDKENIVSNNVNEIEMNVPFQIDIQRRCPNCNIRFIDFFLQRKTGCTVCWIEFGDEISEFIKNIQNGLDYFSQRRMKKQNPFQNSSPQKKSLPTQKQIITGGIMSMPEGGHGEFSRSESAQMHKIIKEKEQDFRERSKQLEDSIKSGFCKFVTKDKEYMDDQIKKNEERITKLIDSGKYTAAKILKNKVNNLKKNIKNEKNK